jgi:hypothetical protein
MIQSNEINKKVEENILNGNKIPHSLSYPVIRKEKEKYYLALFLFFYSADDIRKGTVDRPTLWVLADIATGDIVVKRECENYDFSDADIDKKYDVKTNITSNKYNVSPDYYEDAFKILDSVRGELIKTGKFLHGDYQKYLYKILGNTPNAYRRFYLDLSV